MWEVHGWLLAFRTQRKTGLHCGWGDSRNAAFQIEGKDTSEVCAQPLIGPGVKEKERDTDGPSGVRRVRSGRWQGLGEGGRSWGRSYFVRLGLSFVLDTQS